MTNRQRTALAEPLACAIRSGQPCGQIKRGLRLSSAFLIALLLVLSTAGCAGQATSLATQPPTTVSQAQPTAEPTVTTAASLATDPSVTPEPSLTAEPTAAPSETRAIADEQRNFMTGEILADPLAPKQRPMAFMINNTKIATPQIGTSFADLIFETEIEGGVTRMLAVFTDVRQVPELGSLRSLRHNFIDLAGGLDAIIVHIGWSYAAEAQVKRQGTNNINLAAYPSAWWRDDVWWRERGKEHSVKTTSERMSAALVKSALRTELSKTQVPFCAFHDPGVLVPANGEAAGLVTIPFSGYNTTTLTWDQTAGLYSKGEYGKPQLDLATGEPLQFTNALILLTSITSFEETILRQIDLSQGNGFYVSGGRAEPITWRKGGTHDPFFFATATGEPLIINTGKTYIAIVSLQRTIRFEP